MDIPMIVTGDDVSIPVQLKKGVGDAVPAPFAISVSATVKARIVATNHESTLSAEVTQSRAAPGADWANSLVVVQFSGTDTSAITFQGKAKVEIQVDDGGKQTWWIETKVRRGNIS